MELENNYIFYAAQKIKFSVKNFVSKCHQIPQFPAELITFTEEILNGILHFLCSVNVAPILKFLQFRRLTL